MDAHDHSGGLNNRVTIIGKQAGCPRYDPAARVQMADKLSNTPAVVVQVDKSYENF
jgi:hypothetical protein